jgi:hypothetical protein
VEALVAVWPEVALARAPPAPVPEDDATSTALPHAAIVSPGVMATIATRAVEDFIAARSIVTASEADDGEIPARRSRLSRVRWRRISGVPGGSRD